MVMYLDFRPSDPGSIPGVDDNMDIKILNLWDYASRGSMTIADSRIVAVGKNKQMIIKTPLDWTTHVTTVVPLSDGSWWRPETKTKTKKQKPEIS